LGEGDIMVSAGVGITPNDVVEGKLQLANLKQMLLSIREETNRWLGLLDLGLLWDEANHTASLRQGPTVNEMGLSGKEENRGLGQKLQDLVLQKAKGKEVMEAHHDKNVSPAITYSRRIQSKPLGQSEALSGKIGVTAERL